MSNRFRFTCNFFFEIVNVLEKQAITSFVTKFSLLNINENKISITTTCAVKLRMWQFDAANGKLYGIMSSK